MQQTLLSTAFIKAGETRLLRRVAPVLVIAGVLLFWQVITMLEVYPTFIIPPPRAVAEQFVEVVMDGRLWFHTQVTLSAVLAGLFVGSSVGVILGYLIARHPLLEAS
jgi:ABC-type nitrate/sulfonate/bicarbonate transport system permease component